MTNIRSFVDHNPTLGDRAYVDPSAQVIGNVVLGDDTSIWPLVVVRGDVNKIRIGHRSNIQDGSVIHVSRPSASNPEGYATTVGEDVVVGHKVMLHGCTIGDRVLIGMSSIILDGVTIEDEVVVGAGSLIPPGKTLESGYLYLGSPVRQVRPLTDAERENFRTGAAGYVALKNQYLDSDN